MIVGVYGIGYLIAATNPSRHWPIVLVGLLGKILGPIGFLDAATRGLLPWRFGIINIFNDLIWLLPFSLILLAAYKHHNSQSGADALVGMPRTCARPQSKPKFVRQNPTLPHPQTRSIHPRSCEAAPFSSHARKIMFPSPTIHRGPKDRLSHLSPTTNLPTTPTTHS